MLGAIKTCLLTSLFSLPFSLLVISLLCVKCSSPTPRHCVHTHVCVTLLTLSVVCLCVVDTVLLSTTSSLCSRPTTGPPSVFVFPTFTLNSSSLSTTSWSGTVQCSIPLPQHLHLAPSNGTCLCSFTGTGTL